MKKLLSILLGVAIFIATSNFVNAESCSERADRQIAQFRSDLPNIYPTKEKLRNSWESNCNKRRASVMSIIIGAVVLGTIMTKLPQDEKSAFSFKPTYKPNQDHEIGFKFSLKW